MGRAVPQKDAPKPKRDQSSRVMFRKPTSPPVHAAKRKPKATRVKKKMI
jgi:hypothetical protein